MQNIPRLLKNHYCIFGSIRQEEDFQEKDHLIKSVMEHDPLLLGHFHHSKNKNSPSVHLKIFYYYMTSFKSKDTSSFFVENNFPQKMPHHVITNPALSHDSTGS